MDIFYKNLEKNTIKFVNNNINIIIDDGLMLMKLHYFRI